MAKTWLAGADGCKEGWVVVLRESRSGEMLTRVVTDIEEVLRWNEPPAVLCIDVPIGLLEQAVRGGRVCDRAARGLLGQPRARSVFSPPARAALAARNYTEALRLNRASAAGAPGISRQCYGILPKIKEVDSLMTPSLQERVLEVHPELA
ncbi:MAG TPA: DUF429 domain-containing protein, partial [Vicinamibacteria bacterium]|nr:DUF429 domain-containing protein [Vicinamibacteria bacterium]